MLRPYSAMSFPDRALAETATERVAERSWLVAGRLMVSPFPDRPTGPTRIEAEAISAMGVRLASDRRAGRLPDCPAFWFSPPDRYTPLTLVQAWLRVRMQQHTAVDLRLLADMGGRVVPVQILVRPVSRGATTRRAPVAVRLVQAEATIAAA